MPVSKNSPDLVKEQVETLLQSKKYRELGIPEETLYDMVQNEMQNYRSSKDAIKSVRQKLHNVMAPYLGDPDYARENEHLEQVSKEPSPENIQTFCQSILQSHASTRERYPILPLFYEGIFNHCGQPRVILDLACGLNPFALPWMNLPSTVSYYAYDINQPRVDLINAFFVRMGLEPLAETRDILLSPPEVEADVAFLFKEAHRLEQRRRGCNLPLWKTIKARHLLVSLPASSLSGQHDLADRQRHLVRNIVGENQWQVVEMIFGNEMVFCIEKN